jgi:hypothetical protein|tara:strand:+ start:67 stop:459 length:393 start_codon:yes stop_codon:yes gene_type:complete
MEGLILPDPKLPIAPVVPRVNLDIPTAEIPTYKPIVVPPNDLRPPDGVKAESEDEQPTGMKEVQLPVLNFKVPVPENEILITAGTTAVVSVAATLTATAAFKWAVTALKPILKTTWKKLSQSKKKGSLAK